MNEYDITLKSVLRRLSGVLRDLTGFTVTRWHNVELPAVQERRADMLGETADGTLVHIELQSTNQSDMALRMLEYGAAIFRQFGRFPEQVVLYVGRRPMRMEGRIALSQLVFSCRMVDIRTLDGEPLIASRHVEDNVIAVLARIGDERNAVRRILRGIVGCGKGRRTAAVQELTMLAGLRGLAPLIKQEMTQMPITADIMKHPIFGPAIKKGQRQGRQEGLKEGLREGLKEGLARERQLVLKQIGKRFGPVPVSARKRLEVLPPVKLEKVALRLMDAESLDELLR